MPQSMKHIPLVVPLMPLLVVLFNSVIVDLQRKNQDLKMKVEMMSEAALNGNGPDSSPLSQ